MAPGISHQMSVYNGVHAWPCINIKWRKADKRLHTWNALKLFSYTVATDAQWASYLRIMMLTATSIGNLITAGRKVSTWQQHQGEKLYKQYSQLHISYWCAMRKAAVKSLKFVLSVHAPGGQVYRNYVILVVTSCCAARHRWWLLDKR